MSEIKPKTMTLCELAEKLGTRVHISWRHAFDDYSATLCGCEVMERGMLLGTYGNGRTIKMAMEDYAKKITNKRIVVRAMCPDRKELQLAKVRSGNVRAAITMEHHND